MRGSRRYLSLLFVGAPLILTACPGGVGSDREDFVETMLEVAELSEADANCVADAIYDDGKFSDDQLKEAAVDFAEVEGFADAVLAAAADCTG